MVVEVVVQILAHVLASIFDRLQIRDPVKQYFMHFLGKERLSIRS